jgi:hypothetical protein
MSGLIESPRSYYRRAGVARRDCRERLRAVEPVGNTSSSAYILSVTMRNDVGDEWRAVGGGATLAEALAFALDSAPPGRWAPVAWQDLYGS